jgi:hypothetical protein
MLDALRQFHRAPHIRQEVVTLFVKADMEIKSRILLYL